MLDPAMTAQSRIRVEFFYDPQFGLWHYAVNEPDLPGINGGGQPTLEEARHDATEVIAAVLRSEERPASESGVQVEYLPVLVG